MFFMTRACTGGCDSASRLKSAAAMTRHPAHRLGDHAHAHRRVGQRGDRAHPRRRRLPADGLGLVAVDEQRARGAGEQELQARRRIALLHDELAGRDLAARHDLEPRAQLVVGEVVEEVDPPQVLEGDAVAHGQASSRYWWMSDTAIDPSPTALATRLIERARTSPATNTPGTLVSSR